MNTIQVKVTRLLLGVAFVLSLFSCKKEELDSSAGIEVQPSEDQLGLFSTDTFTVECYTTRIDSVRTDANQYQSLGSYNDPIFGFAKNSILTQYRLSSENIDVNQLRSFTVDSVVLAMVYQTYYGVLDPQNFYVYELTEDLNPDSNYYSNHVALHDAAPVCEALNVTPDPNVRFEEDGIEQPAQLRLRLDSAFGRKLFDAPNLAYSSNDEFLKEFKGFYITVDNPSQNSGEGAQLSLNLNDDYSRLLVYYTDQGGSQGVLDYLINTNAAKFSSSQNDYAGSEVGMNLDNPQAGQNRIYVQAMGGLASVIKVPHLKQINKDGPVIINRAQLVMTVENNTIGSYFPIGTLFPFALSEDGDLLETPDRLETAYFDGSLSSDLKYTFTMNRYYQHVIEGRYDDNGLMVRELAESFGRTVISGPGGSSSPLKFVVSYTPIN